MGANPFPPIIRREFKKNLYLLKNKNEKKQKQRQRKKNTKKREYILNERCQFCKKKFVRNFSENRRELFKIFCVKIYFPKIFCPPNICDPNFCPPIFMTSLRRWEQMDIGLLFNRGHWAQG